MNKEEQWAKEFDEKEESFLSKQKEKSELPKETPPPRDERSDAELSAAFHVEDNLRKLQVYENVEFAAPNESLDEIQKRLKLAGWGRRGPFPCDLSSDSLELLVDHLGDIRFIVVIQNKKVIYFSSPSHSFGIEPGA